MCSQMARSGASIAAAALIMVSITACSSGDTESSPDEVGGSEEPTSSATSGSAEAPGEGDGGSSDESECAAPENSAGDLAQPEPGEANYGETVRVQADGGVAKLSVSSPELSTAEPQDPAQMLCSVEVDVTVVEGTIALHPDDFIAQLFTGVTLAPTSGDATFGDREFSAGDSFEGEVTYEKGGSEPIGLIGYEPGGRKLAYWHP